MRNYIKVLFKIRENFLGEFFVRFIYLFLIILGIALTFVVFDKYNVFLKFLLFPSVLLLFGFFFLSVFFNRRKIEFRKYKIDYLIISFILLFCIFNSFYFSESKIEGGHDQGSYSESGILLAKTGSLYINPAKQPFAYTIPGWHLYPNGMLRHHFLPGNAVFLSVFYKLFGFMGIEIANSFLLFFSLTIIYFLIKKNKNWRAGLFWLLFFSFNFYTIYFSRATYVENLQLLFVWFYVYLFIKGYLKKNFQYFIYAFIPLALLATVRLEAFLYFAIYFLLVFYFVVLKRKFNINLKKWKRYLVVFLFGVLIIGDVFIFNPSIFSTIVSTIKIVGPGAKLAHGSPEDIPYSQQIFVWIALFYMFTPVFFVTLFLGILNFFREDRKTKKTLLLIVILIFPQFAFLIRPGIAFYLPWAMRRQWSVFIPFVFLLFSLFLSNKKFFIGNKFKKLSLAILGTILFLILSLPGFSILFLKQGKGVLQFEQKVASNFRKDDLVIFWDRYQYENWGPPLYFLYGTNVVFDRSPAFDPQIYALIIKNYKNVYIATSRPPHLTLDHPYFFEEIKHIKTFNSEIFKFLGDSCDVRRYLVWPKTFEGYHQIKELCTVNNPTTKVIDYQINLNIYKINDSFKKEFVEKYYDSSYKITKETKNIWH